VGGVKSLAAQGFDAHHRAGIGNRLVADHGHPRADGDQLRDLAQGVGVDGVGGGVDAAERHRRDHIVAELRFQPAAWALDIADFQPARIGADRNGCDRRGVQPKGALGLGYRLDRGVQAVATGVQLVFDILKQEHAPRKTPSRVLENLVDMGVDKPLRPAHAVVAGHETPRGQRRRLDAVPRSNSSVERLAHRAELRFQAGGAGGDEAQRLPSLLARQPQHPRRRDRRAESARRRRLMETPVVMRTAQHDAGTNRGFGADQQRVEHLRRRSVARLAEGEGRRQHRHRGVADVGEMGFASFRLSRRLNRRENTPNEAPIASPPRP